VANGGVIHEQFARKTGIYSRKAGQYPMWLYLGIEMKLNSFLLPEKLMAYQLVGGVMAYQGDDG